jgi:hypothetical protein
MALEDEDFISDEELEDLEPDDEDFDDLEDMLLDEDEEEVSEEA